MIISIIGKRKVNFTPEDRNQPIEGTSVYYAYEDEVVEGLATGKLFVPINRNDPFEIGKTYNFVRSNGRIDWSSISIVER